MSVRVGDFNVADYGDYKDVQEKIKEYDLYLKIASDLQYGIYNSSRGAGSNISDHHYAEELLRKTTYNVGMNNGVWSGQDAETYANTAREICQELRNAEDTFVEGLQEVVTHCLKQIEHYEGVLKKIESDWKAVRDAFADGAKDMGEAIATIATCGGYQVVKSIFEGK